MYVAIAVDQRSIFAEQCEIRLFKELQSHRAFSTAGWEEKEDSLPAVVHSHRMNAVQSSGVQMLADGRKEKEIRHLAEHVEIAAVHRTRMPAIVENGEPTAKVVDVCPAAVAERDVARGDDRCGYGGKSVPVRVGELELECKVYGLEPTVAI